MRGFLEDFKNFALRGNMVDLAVGIVIGGAFSTIVKSLVDDILMPPIGLLTGNVNFAQLFWVLKPGEPAGPYTTMAAAQEAGAVTLNYGRFINNVVSFLIVALSVFVVVRLMNRLYAEKEAPEAVEPTERDCPYCFNAIPIKATRCPYCTSALS